MRMKNIVHDHPFPDFLTLKDTPHQKWPYPVSSITVQGLVTSFKVSQCQEIRTSDSAVPVSFSAQTDIIEISTPASISSDLLEVFSLLPKYSSHAFTIVFRLFEYHSTQKTSHFPFTLIFAILPKLTFFSVILKSTNSSKSQQKSFSKNKVHTNFPLAYPWTQLAVVMFCLPLLVTFYIYIFCQ